MAETDPAYQIAASTNNRVRVVAGPGTGKSFAMKRRVARLLEEGVGPTLILPVTFTRVAATDLHRELIGMAVPGCDELRAYTLHSLALRILMRNSILSALGRVPRTLSAFETEPLICDLATDYDGKKETRKLVTAFEAAWARLQQDLPGYAPTEVEQGFSQDLISWLEFHQAMLIGEVVPQLYTYLNLNPAAAERTEYRHILVDEFQDLNRAEQELIVLLSDSADVCIVGDDDQSIYSFKHAHPEGIREWLNVNPGAEDRELEYCRRCPTRIVTMANSLIGHNKLRPVRRALKPIPANGPGDVRILQYDTRDREVAGITQLVAEMLRDGVDPGEILILTQSKAFGSLISKDLRVSGAPTKSYYAESEFIQDSARRAFALLNLLSNNEDRVALRWLLGGRDNNWHSTGYRGVREHCEQSGATPWETLSQLESGTLSLPKQGRIVQAFKRVREQLEELATLANLISVVDRLLPEGDASTRELRDLALLILNGEPEINPVKFTNELRNLTSQPEIPTQVEEVRIMSLHKSKGLSAPVTIIAGCVEGLLPRAPKKGSTVSERLQNLEEQRRLFYVGLTRVKAEPANGRPGTLFLTYSQQMPPHDAHVAGITPASTHGGRAQLHASRFIEELGSTAPPPIRG